MKRNLIGTEQDRRRRRQQRYRAIRKWFFVCLSSLLMGLTVTWLMWLADKVRG